MPLGAVATAAAAAFAAATAAAVAPLPCAIALEVTPECAVAADALNSESAPPFGRTDGFLARDRELVGDCGGGALETSSGPLPTVDTAAAPVIGFCRLGCGSPPTLGVDGARARLFDGATTGVVPCRSLAEWLCTAATGLEVAAGVAEEEGVFGPARLGTDGVAFGRGVANFGRPGRCFEGAEACGATPICAAGAPAAAAGAVAPPTCEDPVDGKPVLRLAAEAGRGAGRLDITRHSSSAVLQLAPGICALRNCRANYAHAFFQIVVYKFIDVTVSGRVGF
jgi:hypothetical protein